MGHGTVYSSDSDNLNFFIAVSEKTEKIYWTEKCLHTNPASVTTGNPGTDTEEYFTGDPWQYRAGVKPGKTESFQNGFWRWWGT